MSCHMFLKESLATVCPFLDLAEGGSAHMVAGVLVASHYFPCWLPQPLSFSSKTCQTSHCPEAMALVLLWLGLTLFMPLKSQALNSSLLLF